MTAASPLIVPLAIPTGPAVHAVLPLIAAALEKRTAPLLPVPTTDAATTHRLITELAGRSPVAELGEHAADTALVLCTSGTTGVPKGAALSPAALTAGARATERALSGPGTWVLALPAHHVAGTQILVRSLVAGTTPEIVDLSPAAGGFRLANLTAALDAARTRSSGPVYTSLVPHQLHLLLAGFDATDDTERGEATDALAALRECAAILVGGAAVPPATLTRCRELGIPLRCSYGMSETCGGVLYDGKPLDIVRIDLDDDGRIYVGGQTMAHGYVNAPDHPAFAARPGWFRTDDAARRSGDALEIVGHLDEAINSGGVKILPQEVERILSPLEGVAQVAVVGVPDALLGTTLCAVVVPSGSSSTPPASPASPGIIASASAATPDTGDPKARELLERLGHAARCSLGRYCAPRHVLLVDGFPLRGPGKIDRRTLTSRAWSHLSGASRASS